MRAINHQIIIPNPSLFPMADTLRRAVCQDLFQHTECAHYIENALLGRNEKAPVLCALAPLRENVSWAGVVSG